MKKIILKTIIISLLFVIHYAKADVKSITEGNVDAKVKLIVFESLTCSHCADFHKNVYPSLKTDFIDKGLILIEFRNFPLANQAHRSTFHLGSPWAPQMEG